jgi:hypothetical protein
MKQILALFLAAVLLSPGVALAQDQPQPLTNQDVVRLVEAKLSHAVIVAKIESSMCAFDTGAAALQELKAKGVPEEIILAMVQAGRPDATNAAHTPPVPLKLTLKAGTPVEIATKSDISSEEVRAGDTILFVVSEPVKVNGVTVIEAGARVAGTVTKAHQGRPFGKAGRLAWQIEYAVAVNEERVPLTFNKSVVGDSKGGTVATAAVTTAALLFPVAPIALLWGFKRGKPAVIPAGAAFHAFVQADATLTITPPR